VKSRIIHTKVWTDGWFQSLNLEERYFFIYLITNEFCNVLDIYELPLSVACLQTKLTSDKINEIKDKLKADGKIDYCKDYIYVSNAYKYQFYKGAKNNYAKLRIIFEMGDEVITHFQKPISLCLSHITKECAEFSVSDTNLLGILSRVIERLQLLNITLSLYPYADTPKNTEIQIQNTEPYKTELSKEVANSIPF
jgi:hypothetical protein